MKKPTISIILTDAVLEPSQATAFVSSENCGGINVFIGTVRNHTKGKTVLRLEFEAYEKMAINEMKKIARTAKAQWQAESIAIHHRTGILVPGDIAVVIAVATPHRAAAFAACQYAIDTLKETVPIWKKEIFEDGEVWVSAHP